MFLSSYRLKLAEVWGNYKECFGNTSHGWVSALVSNLQFLLLPNFHRNVYNLIENWRKCFLYHKFILGNNESKRLSVTISLQTHTESFDERGV